MYEPTRSPARITVLPARWPKVPAGMASRHAQATPNIPTTILFQPVPAIPHLWQESRHAAQGVRRSPPGDTSTPDARNSERSVMGTPGRRRSRDHCSSTVQQRPTH
jgi:hypothetical protein